MRMLCCVAALLCAYNLARAQSDDVKKDIADVDARSAKPFEQREREDAMRRLAAAGDAVAFRKLIDLLNDDFVHIRASAQRELVKAKGDADTPLVKEGITHKQPEVRRRSALALGQRRSTMATEALLSTLKSDRESAVREAAARALGGVTRAQTTDWKPRADVVEAFDKAIKTADASAGASAHELGRLGEKDYAEKIVGLLKKGTPEAAIGACDGLAALGVAAENAEALSKAAGHKDWRVRIAAGQALGTSASIPDEGMYGKAFGALVADADWRVRRRTIEALVELWQPLSAAILVERLPDEEGALALDIVHALEDLTGLKYGYLKDAWINWWKAAGKDRPLADRKTRPKHGWLRLPKAGSVESGGGGATASYFDIPVYAQASAFVFDMSGSMRDPVGRDNPKLRVDVAREELARTLGDLPENTPFNLVIYRYYSEFPIRTETQRAFPKGVQPLNAKNVAAANKWIEGMVAVGWGAFYEGLLAAFEDPAAQVVYFMSDGAPSRGEYVERDELIEALIEARRFSPVVVHGVLVGGGQRDEEFMQETAQSCGGSFADARKRK